MFSVLDGAHCDPFLQKLGQKMAIFKSFSKNGLVVKVLDSQDFKNILELLDFN